MKPSLASTATLLLAATHTALASALSRWSRTPSPRSASNTTSSSTASPTSSSPGEHAPVCGAGFTYCGYILRDHKHFKEGDITEAYCAAHQNNCVNGKTKTDPIQALYICLPPNANPLAAVAAPPASAGPQRQNGDGNGTDTCASSAAVPGNKIELLCSCGRQCLNPMSDHIARCDIPCSS